MIPFRHWTTATAAPAGTTRDARPAGAGVGALGVTACDGPATAAGVPAGTAGDDGAAAAGVLGA